MRYLDQETGELVEFDWKTPYNFDRDSESKRTGLICPEPTLTQQHQAAEADINNIVRNFGVTGQLPQVRLPPSLEDFSEVFDFQSAMNLLAAAKQSFFGLSAEIRNAFGNNPHLFVSQVDTWLATEPGAERDRHLANMRAMGITVAPGPVADKTTLGDVLKAIKEQALPPIGGGQAPPGGAPA